MLAAQHMYVIMTRHGQHTNIVLVRADPQGRYPHQLAVTSIRGSVDERVWALEGPWSYSLL